MTPSTYLQMPVNLQRLCHYAVIKWNISSKYLDIKRKRALNLISPSCTDLLRAVLFHFSPRNLDPDRLRQAYQAKEWHSLYYMHGDSRGGRPWRRYDELMARNYVWYGMAVGALCISITLWISQPPSDGGSAATEDFFYVEPTSWTSSSHGAKLMWPNIKTQYRPINLQLMLE